MEFNDIEALCDKIDYNCCFEESLNILHTRAFVTCFCIENNIECDSFDWDTLVDYLYKRFKNCFSPKITKEAFDLYMSEELV